MLSRPKNYILHILGCLLFISIPVLLSPDLKVNTHLIDITPFRQSLLQHVLLLLFFYANYLYFIPKFYFTRRYLIFSAVLFGSFIITALLPHIIVPFHPEMHGVQNVTVPNGNIHRIMPPGAGWAKRGFGGGMRLPWFFGGALLQFLLVFSLSFLLRVNKRLGDMESEKLKSEVSYLKAQINPHFLFNTLNSLYALALEKSDAAPEAILKLSGMMRYVVTESSREHVALESELNYIRNYISLQQLRLDEATHFSLDINGNSSGKQVSPLVLIPFIENAFKYGLNPERQSEIKVAIAIEGETLTLFVKNDKVNMAVPDEETSGHGIQNTRKRLEFLYANSHSLNINDAPETFEVKLTIQLV